MTKDDYLNGVLLPELKRLDLKVGVKAWSYLLDADKSHFALFYGTIKSIDAVEDAFFHPCITFEESMTEEFYFTKLFSCRENAIIDAKREIMSHHDEMYDMARRNIEIAIVNRYLLKHGLCEETPDRMLARRYLDEAKRHRVDYVDIGCTRFCLFTYNNLEAVIDDMAETIREMHGVDKESNQWMTQRQNP